MSKVVMIPTCMSPFQVDINNKRYIYPAGTEQEVPDEVAFVIARHEEWHNPPIPESSGDSGFEDHETLVKLVNRTIEEFEVPQEVTVIGASAFNACSLLRTIKIHDGVTTIKSYAFNACARLDLREIPAGITTIENSAFVLCHALVEITFKGTPTTIDGAAFKTCNNLKTINVPWAEGEVANAPWGSTNATINYNHAGG